MRHFESDNKHMPSFVRVGGYRMETGDERVITLDWMARFEYFLWLNRLVFNPGGSLIHCNIRQGALFCQCELFIPQAHILHHILRILFSKKILNPNF